MEPTSDNFNEHGRNTRAVCRQGMPLERVIETTPAARFILDCVIHTLMDQGCADDGFLGDNKEQGTYIKKALRDYQGDVLRVTDFVRGKSVVGQPVQVPKFKENIDSVLECFGLRVDDKGGRPGRNDFFADPKDQTGYRCLIYKIRIPMWALKAAAELMKSGDVLDMVQNSSRTAKAIWALKGDDIKEDDEFQVVELQVVPQQIEEIYRKTHPYKRRAEDIDLLARSRELTLHEQRVKTYCYRMCKQMNSDVAEKSGYNRLLLPEKQVDPELRGRRGESITLMKEYLDFHDEPKPELMLGKDVNVVRNNESGGAADEYSKSDGVSFSFDDVAAFVDRLGDRILEKQRKDIHYKYGIYDKVSPPLFICQEMREDPLLRRADPEGSREACSLYTSVMSYDFKENCWMPPEDRNHEVSLLSTSFHFYKDTEQFYALLRGAVDKYAARKSRMAEQDTVVGLSAPAPDGE